MLFCALLKPLTLSVFALCFPLNQSFCFGLIFLCCSLPFSPALSPRSCSSSQLNLAPPSLPLTVLLLAVVYELCSCFKLFAAPTPPLPLPCCRRRQPALQGLIESRRKMGEMFSIVSVPELSQVHCLTALKVLWAFFYWIWTNKIPQEKVRS